MTSLSCGKHSHGSVGKAMESVSHSPDKTNSLSNICNELTLAQCEMRCHDIL